MSGWQPGDRAVRSEFGIIRLMKVLVAVILLPLAALGVTVSPLPFDAAVLSEATTNIPFTVDFAAMSRIEFTLTFDASPTNGVEVSIGMDVNDDGALGLDEADWMFGYDCGTWFQRDMASDRQGEEVAPTTGCLERTFTLRRTKMDAAWDLVRVTRRGVADIGEVVRVDGKRPGIVIGIW